MSDASYPCATCGKGSVGTFAEVPLCQDHLQYVSVYFRQREDQLAQMLLVLKENIRLSLIDGRLPR